MRASVPQPVASRVTSTAFVTSAALLTIVASVVILMVAMTRRTYDMLGAFLLVLALFAATMPIARRIARQEGDPSMLRLIMLALACKLVGSLLRYYVIFTVYGGNADAYTYHLGGAHFAHALQRGTFVMPSGHGIGEQLIQIVIGTIYTFVGPTRVGGFLAFSWISFWGLFLFYRAFRISFPAGDHRRYARLVFFLPSLLFWPSSIGKEAWMLLTLGVAAYGAARALAHRPGGFVLFALGLWGAGTVRPHVALIGVAALLVAYPFRRSRVAGIRSQTSKAIGIALLCLAALLAVGRVERFFGVRSLEGGGAGQALLRTQQQTGEGGSTFHVSNPNSLWSLPKDAFTVLYRPLPYESHNAQSVVASLEGLFLLVLTLASIRRLYRAATLFPRAPYVLFVAAMVIVFSFAFSNIANFGILTRQRSQVLPFFLVLLCVPAKVDAEELVEV